MFSMGKNTNFDNCGITQSDCCNCVFENENWQQQQNLRN